MTCAPHTSPSRRRSLGGHRGGERTGADTGVNKTSRPTRAGVSPNRGNIRGCIALFTILIGSFYIHGGFA